VSRKRTSRKAAAAPRRVDRRRLVDTCSRPPPGHGLDRVDGQVQEHLAQLLGVGAHHGQPLDQVGEDLHPLGPLLLLDEVQRLLDHVVHVERRLIAPVGAGVVEELGHDLVQAVHLLDDDVEELLGAAVGHLVPDGLQVLGRALDRAQRVADLVGQAGRHLAQRRQAVALLHPLVNLRVLHGDADRGGHPAEELDLVRGVGLAQALVPQGQHAQELLLARRWPARPSR
jgi:hypothetical protein